MGKADEILNQTSLPLIHVGVVTYRRAHLLRRALASVCAQTYTNWRCFVINDDPKDQEPIHLIESLEDPRVFVHEPVEKRGATASFNEVFGFKSCDYVSLLEDDNWWEPTFLATMVDAFYDFPDAVVAVGNEKIVEELEDGSWRDSNRILWPHRNIMSYVTTAEAACGTAKICNSSMLVRRGELNPWYTPQDLPVDVTEHFRERVIPQPLLLVGVPLVNFAVTLQTNRDVRGRCWSDYQMLLIGSVFVSCPSEEREELARRLLRESHGRPSPRVASLLATGLSFREARCIWKYVTIEQVFRFALTLARRWWRIHQVFSVRRRLVSHLDWLLKSPLNQSISNFGISKASCEDPSNG